MAFREKRREPTRLLLLAVLALSIELFVVPGVSFTVASASAQFPIPVQLLLLALPRLVLMLVLVALFGPYTHTFLLGLLFVAYVVLLGVNFVRTEVFVNWGSEIGVLRATVPYAAGVVGSLLAFWTHGRRPPTSAVSM